MYAKLSKLYDEVKLLGIKGTLNRSVFEFKRRTGIDAVLRPSKRLNVKGYLNNCEQSKFTELDYYNKWKQVRPQLGIEDAESASAYIQKLLSNGNTSELKIRADKIANLEFQQFGHAWVKYNKLDWYCDPVENLSWPKIHSSKMLLKLARFGDIKLVWELGRFTWVFDLVRAWLVDGDEKHIEVLFSYIEDFVEQNPLYVGPQWTSEQEVAIRALMLVFAQEVLRETCYLTDSRLIKLHALLELHAEYLEHDLDYAEMAIRNNHLIHGALGLYVIANALPWHKKSTKWQAKSRRILIEACAEQWYSDGGYVQPSHNYHRSAWHGMLWARTISECNGDSELVNAIDQNLKTSFRLLYAHINLSNGQLPNWGPNDGALIGSWTECDYSDFRPLLQTLSILLSGKKVFQPGIWDEEAFWFLGKIAIDVDFEKVNREAVSHFVNQGLVVMRESDTNCAVFRCGTPLSRYGQQADQLHVDLWLDGRNVAVDPGSFNYNRDLDTHNWFRGTLGHNTVIVDEVDQMIPHRTFKYLRWAKAKAQEVDFRRGRAFMGVHHGYTRLNGDWFHARVLANIGEDWIVIDRLWPNQQQQEQVPIRLHWQFASDMLDTSELTLERALNLDGWNVRFSCTEPQAELVKRYANQEPFDGWHSRYYNHKEGITAVNMTATSNRETWFMTCFSRSASKDNYLLNDKGVFAGEEMLVSALDIQTQSAELAMRLISE